MVARYGPSLCRETAFLIAFHFHTAGLLDGLQGMLQYQVRINPGIMLPILICIIQWSQNDLMAVSGTAISPIVPGNDVAPTVAGTGLSPNDGYSIQGAEYVFLALLLYLTDAQGLPFHDSLQGAIDTIQSAAQAFGSAQQR